MNAKKPLVVGESGHLEEVQPDDVISVPPEQILPVLFTGKGFIYGLQVEVTSAQFVTMRSGVVTADDNQTFINNPYYLKADISKLGVNGVESIEQASKWYSLFLIYRGIDLDKANGVATNTESSKLIDSSASFLSAELLVGDAVLNSDTESWAKVVSIDSDSQISLDIDIFDAVGQRYVVGPRSAVFLSENHSNPTLPQGYPYKKRIATVRNDSSSNLIRMKGFGGGALRKYVYEEPFYNRVLLNGSATSYTQVDCSAYIPPFSTLAIFLSDAYRGSNKDLEIYLREYGSVASWQSQSKGNHFGAGQLEQKVNSSQIVEYKVNISETMASLFIASYYEEIGVE